MPLSTGDKLGPYEIIVLAGVGGMGEVYKARDTRLDRLVAIKVSNEQFSERFDREARAIGALSHSNICTLYDVGPNYLVMEYIEGTPLKGPLPVDQALKYVAQICEALDAAHRRGIVHRDLKPGNILVTRAGIKLLDFGLAKFGPAGTGHERTPGGDTLTMALTGKNEIVGTLYYMSPEQLQSQGTSQEIDARCDIFSLGLVLYEMLTGKRAFEGSSPASVIAAIMERPAPSLGDIGPPTLDRVLQRCLEKEPENRWQSARDLKSALELVQFSPSAAAPARPAPRLAWWIAATAAVAMAAIAGWAWRQPPAPAVGPPIRFDLAAPPDTEFGNPFVGYAVSPDGRLLVFNAKRKGAADSMLWLRPLDSFHATELPGTENGNGVFWSPDSKSIGFVASGKLKRKDLAGGAAQILCDVSNFEGGTWSTEGVILFGSTRDGLRRVPAAGGTPEQVTVPVAEATASGESTGHRHPFFLPDGRKFLYTTVRNSPMAGAVFLSSLDDPSQRVQLVSSDAKVEYAPPRSGYPGYLLWVRDQALVAQPFDASSGALKGDPLPVADGIFTMIVTAARRASYSVSRNGVLVCRTGGASGFELIWMSREGKLEKVTSTNDPRVGDPVLSPDGRRVALERQIGPNFDVWFFEFGRGMMTRLTFDPDVDWMPVWSHDGREMIYGGRRDGAYTMYRRQAGGGTEELLAGPSPSSLIPSSCSQDGRYLLYRDGDAISILPLTGSKPEERKPIPYLRTQFELFNPQFSPDGKWVAYVSNESGRNEVYVQAFPLSSGKWQATNDGGIQPRWNRNGKELFFLSNDKLWTAAVRTFPDRVEIAPPQDLFQVLVYPGPAYVYDVAPDGRRFLLTQPHNSLQIGPMHVISGWEIGLKQ